MNRASELIKLSEAYATVINELGLSPAIEPANTVPSTNTATVVKIKKQEDCETCDSAAGSTSHPEEESNMVKNELYKLHKASKELYNLIGDGENLEPWVFSKITVAASYIEGVRNYIEYNKFKQQGEFQGEQDAHELNVVSKIKDMLHGESKEVLGNVIRQAIFNLEALEAIK